MTIRSKIHEYGNENESEWPSKYGTGQSGHFYWDAEKKEFIEGYRPNPNPRYGTAPMVMFDEMPTTYH
jgi:hypothetical protein